MGDPVNIEDYRNLAKRRLPKVVFDYLEGGSEDELGIARNRRSFQRWLFSPNRLNDISKRSSFVNIFDSTESYPFMIAPTGLNSALWPNGDICLARSARTAGIPFILSTASSNSIEQVADSAGGDLWFQLYIIERSLAARLIERALASGYSTLVLTTDVVVNGKRERDIRNGFSMPLKYTPKIILDGILHPKWTFDLLRNGTPKLGNLTEQDTHDSAIKKALMSRTMDASFTWDDIAWIREKWPKRLLIKGILNSSDAERCISAGADGVILSNHGGRQLDDAVTPLDVLAEMPQNLESPIIVDSGIRRGSDIVKAMALGASSVLLGRAVLYGLAANGEAGATEAIKIIKNEFDITLAQLGCNSPSELNRQYLVDSRT